MIFSRDHVRKGDLEYQKGNLQRAAELYLKAKRFRQAAGVYAELGEIDKAVAVYVDAGRPRLAAELLAAEGRYKEAILRYEEAGAYAQAAEASLKAQQPVRAGRLFAQAKMYRRSAEVFVKAGEIERALRAWETASEVLRGRRTEKKDPALEKKIRELDGHRAEILSNVGRHVEAAELMAEHGDLTRAAGFFDRAGRFADAARSYLDAGRITEALGAIERAPEAADELKAEIYLNCARHEAAAEIFERLGRFAAAASAYEGAEDWERAARMWEQAEAYDRAAEFFQRRERFSDAARCFAMDGRHHQAAAAFARAGDDQSAADAYLAAEDHLAAGKHYLRAGLESAARDAFRALGPEHRDFAEASRLLAPLLEPGTPAPGEPAPGEPTPDVRPATAPRDLPPPGVPGETGTQAGVAKGLEKTAPMTARKPGSASGSLTALPFELEERVDPWWSGADFFRAEDRRTAKPVLLVSFPLAEVASRIEGFRQAMRQISALDHPTILKLDETLVASDKVLLVYEAFHGETLGSRLASRRPPALNSLSYVMQLAEALATAHKLGVTHQWVSPRTVLIDAEDRIKLVGIGLRDVLADRDATSRAYFSPEVSADGVVGPASDVYSLGLLGIELLQAQMPAGWADRPQVDPDAVVWRDEVEEAVPQTARDALIRGLAHDPLARPSTAELAAALSSLGLVPGQILDNRYEIRGELGRGGMSRVYRALDRHLGEEEVAIKTVLTPALGPSEDEKRLLSEVRICRKISHPNVVRVHDYGRFAGGIFVTMELLDGPGLDTVIKEESPLSVARVKGILEGIAGALSEAHRLQIIHRDLKPSNVIEVGDRVKVLDFGIARMGDSSLTANLTRTGQVVGSPMFMAPEQIQGQPLAGTCDLYALGVIAYTLLTGREPFLGDTTTAIVMKHLHETPPDIRELRPELAEEWAEMLGRLLAKKPADRYQSAEEVLEVLVGLPV